MRRLLFQSLLMAAVILPTAIGFSQYRSHIPLVGTAKTGPVTWTRITTNGHNLPHPSASKEQTVALVLDVNNDGLNDFVIGSRRQPGPSVVWYERSGNNWKRHVIESDPLHIEAGGTFHDIDTDGDLDIVMGGDGNSNEIWWWENPHPSHTGEWTRRHIKHEGKTRHHDMLFVNVDADPQAEFVYWNQGAARLFAVDIPADPRKKKLWAGTWVIATTPEGRYEGLAAADINGDGRTDLVGGGRWFEHLPGGKFKAHLVDDVNDTRVAVGQIIPGGRPEIVHSPGDVSGMARWFSWDGSTWVAHDLFEVDHAHTLELADINDDGHLDIFLAEMRFTPDRDTYNPDARMLLLLGDSKGGLQTTTISTGHGNHESRVADLDGDGDLDILGKPFSWETPRLDIWLNGLRQAQSAYPAPHSGESTSGAVGIATAPPASPRLWSTVTDAKVFGRSAWPSAQSATVWMPMAAGAPDSAACAPLALGRWGRHVLDADRPGQAVFMFSLDVDGDAHLDVVTGRFWYRNPGAAAGTWTRNPIGGALMDTIAAHDFDGDGDTDLLGTAGPTTYPEGRWAPFVWARNDGGRFTVLSNIDSPMDMPANDPVQGVAVARFRPDGPLQVAVTWDDTENPKKNPYGIQLLTVPGNPSTQAWSRERLSDFSVGEELTAVDIDEDDDLDLFLGNAWLRNDQPANHWTPVVLFETGEEQASRHRLFDIDGDGDLDTVIGYSHSIDAPRVSWHDQKNGPAAPWPEHVILPLKTGHPRRHAESLDAADMDGDGDLDVIVGEYRVIYQPGSEHPANLWILENKGEGNDWEAHLVHEGDSHYQSSQAVDIDGDGDLDILSKGWVHGLVLLYENKSCE